MLDERIMKIIPMRLSICSVCASSIQHRAGGSTGGGGRGGGEEEQAMPPMDTDGEALTADDIEIFSAFADDAMDEGLCLSSAATPAVGYDGPWVQVGRGGGESGGLLDLDMPYTPM